MRHTSALAAHRKQRPPPQLRRRRRRPRRLRRLPAPLRPWRRTRPGSGGGGGPSVASWEYAWGSSPGVSSLPMKGAAGGQSQGGTDFHSEAHAKICPNLGASGSDCDTYETPPCVRFSGALLLALELISGMPSQARVDRLGTPKSSISANIGPRRESRVEFRASCETIFELSLEGTSLRTLGRPLCRERHAELIPQRHTPVTGSLALPRPSVEIPRRWLQSTRVSS